jgi:dinuclear metal center YbgI/SA1388 family protein
MLRDDLTRHLDDLLEARGFPDYGPNGLQVEGRAEVTRLATACTASKAVIDAAVAADAHALIVHHGLFWGGGHTRITGMLKGRIAPLLQQDCSLLGYHLPLDAHPEVGNNAVVLDLLGIAERMAFAVYKGKAIGLMGDLTEPVSAADLSDTLAGLFKHAVVHSPGADRPIRRIGVVTGGGQSSLLEAAEAGCDAFITGEASEQTWHEAAESGCHCFSCGHHATESIAIHRLGASLAAAHDLVHLPIELDNPI